MRALRQVLTDEYGLDLGGWRLERATGVSDDGLVIVGTGRNPGGNTEGWVATVPEPGRSVLLATGAAVLAGARARSRTRGPRSSPRRHPEAARSGPG
jgi:hypothetical protein